jgi:hypothetical protein
MRIGGSATPQTRTILAQIKKAVGVDTIGNPMHTSKRVITSWIADNSMSEQMPHAKSFAEKGG